MDESIVKHLNFGEDAKSKILSGVDKLTNAVSSTLGASGKCVILEDGVGNPVITKDGVTVADSIVLLDPVENMGSKLLKEAARKTVREAGDGTTTATVLAHAILTQAEKFSKSESSNNSCFCSSETPKLTEIKSEILLASFVDFKLFTIKLPLPSIPVTLSFLNAPHTFA